MYDSIQNPNLRNAMIKNAQEVNEFLVDQFLLEVGEGRMPHVGSPERNAYEEMRKSGQL